MDSLTSRFKKILQPSRRHQAVSSADATSSGPSTSKHRSKADDLDFLELASGTDPIVDIVAIHGLDGHREKTWSTKKSILWLRDLLPTDLSNARVLSYGYDADTRSLGCVSTQTMRRHADGFARALARKRKDMPQRPIIFIAHDLGGIILKWALVICHNQGLETKCDLRDILTSTHAILFFGTPIPAPTLPSLNKSTAWHTILKDLRAQSSELENIQSLYVQASIKIHAIFFSAEYMNGPVTVPYSSAVVAGDPNATAIVLHADQRNLVRFAAKDSHDYQTVLHYLKEHVDNATVEVKKKWEKEHTYRKTANDESAPDEVIVPKPLLMTQKLLPDGPVKHQPRCILHGLGGAGKTQLATNWIQENESRFSRVIFVDASSQAQLETDLQRSIRCLGPEYSKTAWKDAVAYLDGKEKGWLLFLDNADSPELDLRPYLPTSIHGKILITTRNSQCINYAPDGAIAVGGLEENEAVNLLHKTANISPESDADSVKIVTELGMLALAITQAGVVGSTAAQAARFRLGLHILDVYCIRPLVQSIRGKDTGVPEAMRIPPSLAHSLALFEKSTTSGFTTHTVLKSYPPPASDKTFISKLEVIFGETWDEVLFQEIVNLASQASLVNVTTDGLFYTVHPLFQMYIQDSLSVEEKSSYIRMTAQLLLGAIRPAEGSNAELWQLLPHVKSIPLPMQSENLARTLAFNDFYNSLGNWDACWMLLERCYGQVQQNQGEKHIESMLITSRLAEALWRCGKLVKAEEMQRATLALQMEILGDKDDETTRTMDLLGLTLHGLGRFAEAEKMQQDVLALRLEVSGPRHPDTIRAMGNLAATLCDLGRFAEAEKMQQDVLALRLEVSGPRHPDTILAMGNLAGTLRDLGRFAEAEKMEQDVLALRLEVSGPRHPDTIRAMANLAATLCDLGRFAEAEKMEQDVLALRLEVSGPRHPDTIRAMGDLAATLCDLGRFAEAEKMQQDVLALRLEVSGPRHPDTIAAMGNLAGTLRDLGRFAEAEKMEQDVLALRLEVSGPRHPDTILAMANLAGTLWDLGRFAEAEKMEQDVLALRLEVSGPRHPDTIVAMANLAATLRDLGRFAEAEKMQQDVLALRLEVSGPRHPDTIVAMGNLALTLRDLGRFAEAEKMQQDVLALRLEVSGPRHPDTIRAMGNLAVALWDLGRFAEAEKMEQDVLALRLEVSGPRHPDTIRAMGNLARTLRDLGRFAEAEKMEQDVLALRLEVSGPRHPDTIVAMGNLAGTLRDLGRFAEAEKMQQDVLALRLEVSGPRHPDTIVAMGNLALTLRDLGRFAEAEKMEQDMLALRFEESGPRHPDTLTAT
ncbi:SubName: Full=Related to kinesin light chain {ECO:0000313/EMBL:CCA74635.1} [Serendipita indica DSM 11827]|nr:SubName: Full=Related to kinesin light chain {ECO:0000313/EMBL:CCA74635.1} [Serendipita indica DSM 11827]